MNDWALVPHCFPSHARWGDTRELSVPTLPKCTQKRHRNLSLLKTVFPIKLQSKTANLEQQINSPYKHSREIQTKQYKTIAHYCCHIKAMNVILPPKKQQSYLPSQKHQQQGACNTMQTTPANMYNKVTEDSEHTCRTAFSEHFIGRPRVHVGRRTPTEHLGLLYQKKLD